MKMILQKQSNIKTYVSDLQEEKQIDELKAKKEKEANDKFYKNNKLGEDEISKTRKRDIEQDYKDQLIQKDKNLKDLEKTINDEYQKELKLINDNIHNLQELRAKCESDIQHSEEQRKKAIENILMLTQQIEDGEDLSKGQEASIKCLYEAKSALNNIQKL